MAITVHQNAGVDGAANDNSIDVSFSSTPTVGRLVVVCANFLSAAQNLGSITCSDNQGNTYTAQQTVAYSARNTNIIWTAPVTTASGTFTVTVAVAGMEAWANTAHTCSIHEISGHNASSIVDEIGYNSGSATSVTISMPTMSSDSIVFGLCKQEWGSDITAGSGWTEAYKKSTRETMTIYRVGDNDPAWTLELSNNWNAIAVGINAAAAATGNPYYAYAQQQ